MTAQDNAANLHNGMVMDENGQPVAPMAFPQSHVQREKIHDDKEARIVSGRLWLISFTDLFSIMLCFFVLLYSMKDPDFEKLKEIDAQTGGGGYAGTGTQEAAGENANVNIERVAYGAALDLSYLEGVLRQSLKQAGLEKDVTLKVARDHLKLLVDADPGSADGVRIAKELGLRLTNMSNRITVVGLPTRWSSGDWAGSVALGTSFAANMTDGGYRKRLTVIGQGQGNGPGIEIRVEADDGRVQ